MFRTYEDAVNYILEVPRFTSKTSLDHTRRLLELLGDPEEGQKILHIAGTNGKGSVCAALDAMLRAGGHTVGMFTSPHLIRINERFQINGEPVGDDAFLDAFRKVMQASEQIMKEGEAHPTFFEILFLMGMLLFKEAGTEYTILETGMGGRLDATNVIRDPLVTVITSVSMDHTQYLGETVREIAGEKAGILKRGVPVIYDACDPEVCDVIEKKAAETGSPAYPLSRDRNRDIQITEKGTIFRFLEDDGSSRILQIPQFAPYQVVNAALAWYTLRNLEQQIPLSEEARMDGLTRISWPCRMQAVAPGVFIDGAHNPDGTAAFIESVRRIRSSCEVTLLFSAVNDKRYTDMIRELAEGIRPENVVTTRISGARAVPEEKLADLFRQNGCRHVYAERSPEKAWEKAKTLRKDGLLFCVGSLYLAGEILAAERRIKQ